MTKTINNISIYGYIGNISEKITTEKSSFHTMSVSTKRGKATDWHKVIIFDSNDVKVASGFELGVGDFVRIDGQLSYRDRPIKDANGNLVTTVKEASVIASIVFGLEQKQAK